MSKSGLDEPLATVNVRTGPPRSRIPSAAPEPVLRICATPLELPLTETFPARLIFAPLAPELSATAGLDAPIKFNPPAPTFTVAPVSNRLSVVETLIELTLV